MFQKRGVKVGFATFDWLFGFRGLHYPALWGSVIYNEKAIVRIPSLTRGNQVDGRTELR